MRRSLIYALIFALVILAGISIFTDFSRITSAAPTPTAPTSTVTAQGN